MSKIQWLLIFRISNVVFYFILLHEKLVYRLSFINHLKNCNTSCIKHERICYMIYQTCNASCIKHERICYMIYQTCNASCIKHERICYMIYQTCNTSCIKHERICYMIYQTCNASCIKHDTVCYVICQTRKVVFHHISKHQEESWKYNARRGIFDKLLDKLFWQRVLKYGQRLSRVFDISSQSKLKKGENREVKS